MRRSASIALLVSALPAVSFAAQTSASSDHLDHIRGIVLNSVTHEPIARALVYSPDSHFATLTNDRGRFDFALPSCESSANSNQDSSGTTFTAVASMRPSVIPYALAARKPGFLARQRGQDVVAVDSTQPDVTLYLVPEARIVGRVVLPGSASFQIYDGGNTMRVNLLRRQFREGRERWDPTGQVEVRSDGEFRFFDLPAGDYKVQTSELLDRDPLIITPNGQQFGFPPVFFPSSSDIGSATILHLAPGETLQGTISLTRREYYPVRLRVTNAPPNTPPEVSVWPAGQPGPGFDLGYDVRQTSVRGLLPDGTYTVTVIAHSTEDLTGTATLTIRGAPVFGPTITLVPNPSISVVFQEQFTNPPDRENKPTSSSGGIHARIASSHGYDVLLYPDEPFSLNNPVSLGSTSNPEHTTYAFSDVPPGRYRVRIFNHAGIGYAAAITAGGTDLLKEPLVVGIGSAPPQIEITMRDDGATINGELIDSQAGSATDALTRHSSVTDPHPVYFLPISGNGAFTVAWAQSNGKFQLRNLPPGDYNVLAFHQLQADLEQQGEPALHQYESQSTQITATPNQTLTLRVPLITVPE
jgi:hypothetical protein